MSTPPDTEIVRAFLDATANLSQDEAAARVEGVIQNDVSRWRRGDWKRLSAKKRRALVEYLRRNGPGAREVATEVEDPVDEWARAFEERVRYGVGKIPGISEYERRARMRDAVESQIQALQMIGNPVPDRLFKLREELRRGDT